MQPHKNGDEYTVEFAEGWRVHVDTIKNNYTVSRDSRSVTFNDFTWLPKCNINYSLTMRQGQDQISIPELLYLSSALGILITIFRKWEQTVIRINPTSRAGGQDYGSFNKLHQISNALGVRGYLMH